MNKYRITPLLSLFLFLLLQCKSQSSLTPTYFSTQIKQVLVIPVILNDSITANMLFDTGSTYGYLALDSTFFYESNMASSYNDSLAVRRQRYATSWTPANSEYHRTLMVHKESVYATIGGGIGHFSEFRVYDMKRDYKIDVDGVIAFPRDDSTHVWELNFAENYIKIHNADNFQAPDNSYTVPLINGADPNMPYVQLPISMQNINGEKISFDIPYLIDCGLTQDIVLTHNVEKRVTDFFDRSGDAVFINRPGGYRARHIVSLSVFEGFNIDSVRIYTDTFAQQMSEPGIIGLNFMKRFNVFFNFKTKEAVFQPIDNFKRSIDPYANRFYYAAENTKDGRILVKDIADIVSNPYKKAGLRVGDEIVSFNNVAIADLTPEIATKLIEETTRVIEIIRNETSMKITVILSSDELSGE